eukprot:978341-Amphidinium_carterae.1
MLHSRVYKSTVNASRIQLTAVYTVFAYGCLVTAYYICGEETLKAQRRATRMSRLANQLQIAIKRRVILNRFNSAMRIVHWQSAVRLQRCRLVQVVSEEVQAVTTRLPGS